MAAEYPTPDHGAIFWNPFRWITAAGLSTAMALSSIRTTGVLGLAEIGYYWFVYLPLCLFVVILQCSHFRQNIIIRTIVAISVTLAASQFLSAQFDIIHFKQKFLSTAAICGIIFLASFIWPVGRQRSTESTIASAAGSLVVFLGMLLLVAGLGGQESFLIHNRQRALGTVASMVTFNRAPSIDAVLEGDGLQRASAGNMRLGVEASQDRPPIVLVVVDTWRADTLSFWGDSGETMPGLEALAGQSVVFTDVLSNASWTRPSMASMFTGMTPESAGVLVRDDVLGSDLITVAEVLRDAGYTTSAFMTNPQLFRGSGYEQGFDFFAQIPDSRRYCPAENLVERVKKWAKNAPQLDDPQFVYIHFMDPHRPYLKPTHQSSMFRRFNLDLYMGELTYLDRIFIEFVEYLYDVLGPETVMVVVSDHGEEFGDHGRWGHGQSLYPELTRIPVIVRGRSFEPGTVEARLEGRDVFSLLLWLAGPGEENIESWARDRNRTTRVTSSYNHVESRWRRFLRPYRTRRIRAVETEDWLFVRNAFGSVDELYDLGSDPECLRNRAAEFPEVVEQLWNARRAQVASYRTRQSRDVSLEELERLEALGYVQ